MMSFAHCSLKKNNKEKLAYKLIFLLSSFFQKNINSIKNFFSNIVASSMAKSAKKEKVHLPCQISFRKTVYFTEEKSAELC